MMYVAQIILITAETLLARKVNLMKWGSDLSDAQLAAHLSCESYRSARTIAPLV